MFWGLYMWRGWGCDCFSCGPVFTGLFIWDLFSCEVDLIYSLSPVFYRRIFSHYLDFGSLLFVCCTWWPTLEVGHWLNSAHPSTGRWKKGCLLIGLYVIYLPETFFFFVFLDNVDLSATLVKIRFFNFDFTRVNLSPMLFWGYPSLTH